MYSLFTTNNNFVIKREDGKNSVLVIDRSDTGSLELKTNADLPSLGVGGYHKIIYCIIGIVRIGGDTYLIVASHATNVATIGCSQVLKITETEFISFRTGLSVGLSSNGGSESGPAYHQMQTLLSSGHFYFSTDTSYDITHAVQVQPDTSLPIWERVDVRFFWNKFIQRDFITNQLTDWCVPVMEGFVESKAGGMIHGNLIECILISRRSRFRAGTRYNSRGVDDDGNVANFVETEQIVTVDKHIFSFVQIRGSVPVFWEQTSAQLAKFSDIKITKFSEIGKFATKVSNKIQVCRTPQSTTPAFKKHFKDLIGRYGSPVCLNLLSISKSGEKALVEAFEHQMKNMDPNGGVRYIYFDVNEHCKGGAKMDKLDALLHNMYEAKELSMYIKVRSGPGGWRVGEKGNVGKETLLQQHVVRTNCKDCLDRTNLVQSRIAWKVLEYHMRNTGLIPPHQPLEELYDLRQAHMTLWANNGDDISIMYAGSGSLKSNLTRTGETSIKGWLDDGKKSVTRFYMNNFRDSARQEGIEQLLGLHPAVKVASPAEVAIQKAMASRVSEYTTSASATIFIGTFNAGAQDPGYESLSEWLDTTSKGIELADIYAIGIQEVCELTPGKILATDPERGMIWERELKRYLPGYVQVQSHQLVGLLMCLFVKEELVDCIRDVQYEITKVGLRGMAGNKGGIAIHLVFHNSSLCFVTAHLAAGQSNVDERNSDYQEINDQSAFGRSRNVKIAHHHYVFWFGDFNYRIDLPDDEVRRCVSAQDLEYLLKCDQLNKYRLAGQVFQQYQEAPIIFNPTYKYDMHTQIYDTSPKNRVPAWTDRILWKQQDGTQTSLLFYDRAEITLSDHRPVSAYFRIEVKKTDKQKERQTRKQIIASKSYSPNGADVKDIISWDDTPAVAAAQLAPGSTKSTGVLASLLDFDFDPRGTLIVSPTPTPASASASASAPAPAPAAVPQSQPPQRPLSQSSMNPTTTKKLPPLPAGAKPNPRPPSTDLLSAPNSANTSRSSSPINAPRNGALADVYFDPFNNFPMPPQQPQHQSNPFVQSMPNLPMAPQPMPMTQPMPHTPPKPNPPIPTQPMVPNYSMPNLPMPPPQMQLPIQPVHQQMPMQQPMQPMPQMQPMQSMQPMQPMQPIPMQQPIQPTQQPIPIQMQMQPQGFPTQQQHPNDIFFDPLFSNTLPKPSSQGNVPRLVPPPASARPRQNSAASSVPPKDQFDLL